MRPTSTFVVTPNLPPELTPLRELIYNFWWTWNADAIDLLRRIDDELWRRTDHNPVAVLNRLPMDAYAELASSGAFMKTLSDVHHRFRAYMESPTWYSRTHKNSSQIIAYFCAEFGIHESFMNYSGGLGALAGDHLKTASDLGIPIVGVGLLYQHGYFRQYLTQDGWQRENYEEVDFFDLPLVKITDHGGAPITVHITLPEGNLQAHIWRMNVGRVPLYLLDTNVAVNETESLRDVTDELYGGTLETRIKQEMLLGIGGVRALTAMGIEASVVHVNEGHAAFCLLERARELSQRLNLSFPQAWTAVQSGTVFTTHTPVPAGNEIFSFEILDKLMRHYVEHDLEISWQDFSVLGSPNGVVVEDGFSMTVLGLKGSSHRNGVSELHGRVARNMWHNVWSHVPADEVPIRGITNGIHTPTWVSSEVAGLFDRYLPPEWRTNPGDESIWGNVGKIPDMELWRTRDRRREKLVLAARTHIRHKHNTSLTQEQMTHLSSCLDPDVLTVGFARRFATYKRADMLMRDMDRLARIIGNASRPIQIIMAGKAHPRDTQGKEMIQKVIGLVRSMGLDRRIVFLEDYDMSVARMLVRGCDVWLNTPRRPFEASGTSGMKAVLNGSLHCSVLDGWWAEGYNGANGFAIGLGEESADEESQDRADANTLYDLLENKIAPMFYERDQSRIPIAWIEMIKKSVSTLAWKFSAHRMLTEYVEHGYAPALRYYASAIDDGGRRTREYVEFATRIQEHWNAVHISNVRMHGATHAHVGKRIGIEADVSHSQFDTSEIWVEAICGRLNSAGEISSKHVIPLTVNERNQGWGRYRGEFECAESGLHGCTIRVTPQHDMLKNAADAHVCALSA